MNVFAKSLIIVFLFIAVVSISLAVEYPDSTRDPAFGIDGVVVTNLGYEAYKILLDEQQRIVVGTYLPEGVGITRFLSNGTLDTSFGNNGKALLTRPDHSYGEFADLIQLEDGSLVGVMANPSYIIIQKYLPDGILNTSFGDNGAIILQTFNERYFSNIGVQQDGKLIVFGTWTSSTAEDNLFFLRFNAEGSPDNTFGDAGLIISDLIDGDESIQMLIDAQDRILITGYRLTDGANGFVLARFDPNGNLDPLFGEDGKIFDTFESVGYPRDIILQPDGKIILFGDFPGFKLNRYLSNGSPDPDFGDAGKVILSMADNLRASKVLLQPDGKIILLGYTDPNLFILTTRLHSNGKLDLDFAGNEYEALPGWKSDLIGNFTTTSTGAIQFGTTILIGGLAYVEDPYDGRRIVLLRYGQGPEAYDLSAEAVSDTSITLNWKTNAKAISHRVERSLTGSNSWTPIGMVDVNTTSFTDTNLSCETPYFYRVIAIVTSGDTAPSNVFNATTDICFRPSSTTTATSDVTPSHTTTITPAATFTYIPTADMTMTYTFTPTASVTNTAEQDLLTNGGFEDEANGWTSKNATSDKPKCNKEGKIIAYEGECAYQFKGSVGENSKLQQSVDLGTLSLATGDTLTLMGYIDAKGVVNAAVKVSVTYANSDDKGKISAKIIAATEGYQPLTSTPLVLPDMPVAIKVQLTNKSTSGRVRFDAISLKAVPSAELLPLP